ncbi:hypothetical protein SNL152K_10330 [Streptomyces sp. NL15-2K]|nr:hypothetical protein SNL152K_10330 [Streptomyces sp. NL15-2K]
MAHAQPLAGRTVVAAGDGALGQFSPPDRAGAGIGDERFDVGASAPLPAVVMTAAELTGAGLPWTSGNPAGSQPEDQLSRSGDEHTDAELRPDRSHEFAQ